MAAQDDVALYLGVVDRIDALVSTGVALHRRVAACPDWTVAQLLGHLTGIAEDWTTGRFEGYASAAWTDAQVARHAGRSWDELRVDWRRALDALPTADPHPQLGAPWRWLFGDALCHEADLRETAGDGSRPPDDVVMVGLGQMVSRWRQTLTSHDGRLNVTATGARTWELGGDADLTATVEAEPYELWRAISGRRSIDAVEHYQWTVGRASPMVPDAALPLSGPDRTRRSLIALGGRGAGRVRCDRYSPVSPSIASRIKSTWPLWRAVSSIMWIMIQRNENRSPV
jgi:uncharacterized protein (TIGR03083 family)